MKIAIIDYGVGNLGSVFRSLEELKVNPIISSTEEEKTTEEKKEAPKVEAKSEKPTNEKK